MTHDAENYSKLGCATCKRVLGMAGDPSTADCGGDCLRCMAEAGDPDCIAAMEAANERI